MNWVRASRLYELNDITNDYIESLNMSVAAIAFTRVSDSDMERFCDRFIGKYSNLDLWYPDTEYVGRGVNGESLDVCMGILEQRLIAERLKNKRSKLYILGIYKEPNNTVTIKYSKIIGCF